MQRRTLLATIGAAALTAHPMLRAQGAYPQKPITLVVPSDSVHRIQETHVAIFHILWDLVHTLLADERGGRVDRREREQVRR